ncbi:MAG: cytochrome c-type biogenesis protein CcmH [bacterium]
MNTRILGALLAVSLAAFGAPRLRALQAAGSTPETTAVPARDSALEARTSAVAAQLRCPVCQGLSIQDSPSELAQSMRSVVRDQLAAGKTPDEIEAYFVSKYGEWILLAPKPEGFNIVAYAIPVLAVLCGGAAIALAVRKWTQPLA